MKRQRRKAARKASTGSPGFSWRLWYEGKLPLVRFCLKFLGLIVLLYLLALAPVSQRILAALLAGNAHLASASLNRLGEDTQVTNTTIWSAKYAITVLPACSALELWVFFCATVLAFPSRISRKISGILMGTALLLALNQLRLMSLYYVGAHFPRFFDATHEDVWGIGLVVAEIGLCAAWIAWARESDTGELHAEA
jgi:exosortase/archaeosortase family protein